MKQQGSILTGFAYAVKGMKIAWQERNFRLQVLVTVVVIAFAEYLQFTRTDWMILLLCCAVVLAAECFNTAIEHLVDHTTPGHHENAGKVKDVSAAAVLICAIGAALVAIRLFWPYLAGRIG